MLAFEEESTIGFFCDRYKGNEMTENIIFIGFGNNVQNVIMILFSVLGVFINLFFFLSLVLKIIKNNKQKKTNISTIQKMWCAISIDETLNSICWIINTIALNTSKEVLNNCGLCRIIGFCELFFYLFNWMILIIQKNIYFMANKKDFKKSFRNFKK